MNASSLIRSLGVVALICASAAAAAPAGGQVVAGQASISATPNLTTITQGSNATIINWQQFNIGRGEQVTFIQPTAQSTALNRVIGGSAAQIFGSLTANGRVFLVDPQGVVFGRTAVVDVGGLLASTLDIGDTDFMGGRYDFSSAGVGAVSNAGRLQARDGGFVVLAGSQVNNAGLVRARLGKTVLAAGSALTLDFDGDGLISYAVMRGADGAQVLNTGRIAADGGLVALSAQAAGDAVQAV
ncbi:MAG TPA: filamentous hemagglutinin N-terminal domain-containing protein, partial [Nevskiaceae bacterium]|nr:filamentous hemagglutinin N-terminal domain-containing protein [Nevskiaceae bacterium]